MGCDAVRVDTLYDVQNKILLALNKNLVKNALFSAIAEKKEDHRLREFAEIAEKNQR